ncbi:MAG TPA: DUF2723 domain-containing protein [bacterium]|nr:DUF2723 domain-containing protein [bacterium]
MRIPFLLLILVYEVYLLTHCATFNINDSGETIMVCDLLTISHSPGYPLHTLWGRVCCLLPIGKPMFRVTFCSLITASFSVLMVYYTLRMILKQYLAPEASGPNAAVASVEPVGPGEGTAPGRPSAWLWEIPAFFGSLIFAFSYQHWFQAGGAKGGIYTLNTWLTITLVYLFYKMRERGWFIKSFLLAGFFYGLGLAHHWPNMLVMAPSFLWMFLAGQNRVSMGRMVHNLVTLKPFDLLDNLVNIVSAFGLVNWIKAFLALLLSLSVYLYLPIRATQNPLVNWWNPQTLGRLVGTVLREGYKGVGDQRGWGTIKRDLIRFWLHAHHQYGEVFTYLVFALAIWGIIWLFRWSWKQWAVAVSFVFLFPFSFLFFLWEDWAQVGESILFSKQTNWVSGLGLFLLGMGVWTGIILFNNPLEGYQWTIDNFFSPVFMIISMFAAFGVAGLCQWAAKEWEGRMIPLYISAFVLSFALMPLLLDYNATMKIENGQAIYQGNDQSRYVSSYDEGMNMLKTVNNDGVIICNGDIDILPLWYLQFVEGKRPSVVSFTMQLIPYDWYRNPLFERWPFLYVPLRRDQYGREDIRPETVVQDMIDRHAKDRSFYFTNIFTAPWMREKNPQCLPEGFLWRMAATKNLNYPFTSDRLNLLWDTYRLRNMDAPDRGYWDEYTDVMKDSYGIGFDFTGYFAYMNGMPDLALWSFNNALQYRQPQTLMRIYMMIGDTYMQLANYSAAITNYQESLRREPRNPYALARLGDAFRMMGDFPNADSAYHQSLNLNPQQKEALDGLHALTQAQTQRELPGLKKR